VLSLETTSLDQKSLRGAAKAQMVSAKSPESCHAMSWDARTCTSCGGHGDADNNSSDTQTDEPSTAQSDTAGQSLLAGYSPGHGSGR
jgi:hypothetical protein